MYSQSYLSELRANTPSTPSFKQEASRLRDLEASMIADDLDPGKHVLPNMRNSL